MLAEFKEFAMKGNVVDMAVGVVIGGAFGKIVASFLNDVMNGAFITTVVDFVIVAFAIFMMVKAMNTLKHKQASAPPPPSEKKCVECLSLIPIEAKRCRHCTQLVGA
ncbi:MAG: MscL family protein [Elusimicrobia bacterium]|nr:MscL family protein [Elusimicrobiota bacterium]